MQQSLTKICLHIIFNTKHRQPLINDHIKDELYQYLGGTYDQRGYILREVL